MGLLERIVSEPVFQRIGWAVLHSVWQGALIAGLLVIILAALRRHSANARYVAACAGLALTAILTVVTAMLVPVSAPVVVAERAPIVEVVTPAQTGPISPAVSPMAAPSIPAPVVATETVPAPSAAMESPWTERVGRLLKPCVPWTAAFWVLGVLGISTWHLGGWIRVRRLLRRGTQDAPQRWNDVIKNLARRLRLSRPVRLVASTLAEAPSVIGWLAPVLLMPISALTSLTPGEIEALLAHELAHIRRHDYLINLVQTAVETLLFYHPAVWWMSHRIRVERENSCDDLAVSLCADRLAYARALAGLAELRVPAQNMTVAAAGGSLLGRIRRLLGNPERPSSLWRGGLAGAVAVLLCLAAVFYISSFFTSAKTETKAVPGEGEAAEPAWGEAVNGLRARLIVEKPVIETDTVGVFLSHLEIQNVSKTPISVQGANPFAIEVGIGDKEGKDVPISSARIDQIYSTAWTRIDPGKTINVAVSTAPAALDFQTAPGDPIGIVDTVRSIWWLHAGQYRVSVAFTSDGWKAEKEKPADVWTGLVSAPALQIEVRAPAAKDVARGEATLSPKLREKRSNVLAQADARLRVGLMQLGVGEGKGEGFRHLTRDYKGWGSLAKDSEPGRISIQLSLSDRGKDSNVPAGSLTEKERFSVLALIEPPPEKPEPFELASLYPNLGLVGQVNATAGDPELDAALKKLLARELKPLADLNDEADPTWGEAVQGLQVHLRVAKTRWQAGEMPTFKIDLRSHVAKRLQWPSEGFEVLLDQDIYRSKGVVYLDWPLAPVNHRDGVDLPLSKAWQRNKDGKALELTPGKHTVRVAFTAPAIDWDGGKPPPRAVSNPVEIEILPEKVEEAANAADTSSVELEGGVAEHEQKALAKAGPLTGQTALPQEVKDALERNARQLNPLTVSWSWQLVSPSSNPETSRTPGTVFVYSERFTWQDGKVYDYHGEKGAKGYEREQESACAWKILCSGDPPGTLKDGRPRPLGLYLLKLLDSQWAKQFSDTTFFGGSYFDAAGLHLPLTLGELDAGQEPQSSILWHLKEGATLKSVRSVDLGGRPAVLVEVLAPNPEQVDAARNNLAGVEGFMRSVGQDSEEQIQQRLATIRKQRDLPKTRVCAFYLDPEKGYAARQREERYEDGRLLLRVTNSDFRIIPGREVWLPWSSTWEYFTAEAIVHDTPVHRQESRVSDVNGDRLPDKQFVLDCLVPGLIEHLGDRSAPVRREAAEAFGHMGPAAKVVVPAVVKFLGEPEHRGSAVEALGDIGPAAKDVVPELERLAKEDPTEDVRLAAREALEKIVKPAASVKTIPELMSRLGDPDAWNRRQAARSLGDMGPKAKESVAALIKAVGDPDAHVRRSAALALGGISPGAKEVVDALVKVLGDPDAQVRREAARVLTEFGAASKGAVPELIKALGDPDARVRENAVIALRGIGPEAKVPLPALITVLGDPDADVRYNAAHALAAIGPDAKPAVPALIKALDDTNPKVRWPVARALGWITRGTKDAVPALIKALGDPDGGVRGCAADGLGRIGPEAREAIPALIKALDDPSYVSVRAYAAEALGRIGPEAAPAATGALIKTLEDTHEWVRGNAAEALGKFGPKALDAVPALIKMFEDHDAKAWGYAAIALGHFGPEAKEAVPALIKALGDPGSDVRRCAAEVLGKIGPKALDAVPALIKALGDPESHVQADAARALGGIGPEAKDAVPALIKALADADFSVRLWAARALGAIGPEAREAIPDLERLSEKDPDEYIRKTAREALEKIRK